MKWTMRLLCIGLVSMPGMGQFMENVSMKDVSNSNMNGVKSKIATMARAYEVIYGTTDPDRIHKVFMAGREFNKAAEKAKLWSIFPDLKKEMEKDPQGQAFF